MLKFVMIRVYLSVIYVTNLYAILWGYGNMKTHIFLIC